MIIFTFELPDDLAKGILADAFIQKEDVREYLLHGLLAGINDGYAGENCEDALIAYLKDK